jgi:hypothetical protein
MDVFFNGLAYFNFTMAISLAIARVLPGAIVARVVMVVIAEVVHGYQ